MIPKYPVIPPFQIREAPPFPAVPSAPVIRGIGRHTITLLQACRLGEHVFHQLFCYGAIHSFYMLFSLYIVFPYRRLRPGTGGRGIGNESGNKHRPGGITNGNSYLFPRDLFLPAKNRERTRRNFHDPGMESMPAASGGSFLGFSFIAENR